jgi:hypothetical protein
MATYTRISSDVPMDGRSLKITDVAEGDQIDIVDALGKGARHMRFYLTDPADTISYRINSRIATSVKEDKTRIELSSVHAYLGISNKVEIVNWSQASSFPVYEEEGEAIAIDDILVNSLEIVSLSLSTGTTFEIVVW